MHRLLFIALIPLALVGTVACGSGNAVTPPPTAPPCDEKCQDGIALRALRETVKLAFNLTFQGKPVGSYDLATTCPLGGAVRVTGTALSNAEQGTTNVDITYVLVECGYLTKDDDAKQTYDMKVSGTFTQKGILAVQPTSPSALIMKSDNITFEGTVYDPAVPYNAECPLELGQTGNRLSGKICGRSAEADL